MKVWLYILRHGDPGQALHKVGIARDVEERIAQLQTGNPFRIELVRKVQHPSRASALDTESSMHAILRDQRVNGEWFRGSSKDIEAALYLTLMDTPEEGLLA